VDSSTIAGTLIDATTHKPLSGIAVAAIEQKDKAGIDRVVMSAMANSSGQFAFHSVPPGSYDLVANASIGAGTQYSVNITTGVQPGTQVGNLPLLPSPSDAGVAPSAAHIFGEVDTAGAAGGTNATVTVNSLQQVGGVLMTIPLPQPSGVSVSVTTSAGGSCPAGSNCGNYTLLVPGQNPNVGMFSSSGTAYSQMTGNPTYVIDGQASVPGSSTPDCNPPDVQVSSMDGGGPLTVAPGGIATASAMRFSGCQ